MIHARLERLFDALGPPFRVQFEQTALQSHAIRRHACASSRSPWFPDRRKDQHRIADELVDGAAVLERDRGHFGEVLIEQLRNQLELKPLGGGGEVLDVREEDRELLALGLDRDVLLPAENAFVDLRQI